MMINTKDMTLEEVEANIAKAKKTIAEDPSWHARTIAEMKLRDLLFAYYNLAPRH